MKGIWKVGLLITAAAAVLMAPLLILAAALPTQTSQGLFAACAQLRGARAGIVPDPPTAAPTADEVLLRITRTATTLGFGRKGQVVAAAISLRATELANAANRAVPDTERYAHSVEIDSGAGALALPTSWGSAAELMTPEVSTALLMDHMVNLIPTWRDTDPAALAAQLLGGTVDDYTASLTAAQARVDSLAEAMSATNETRPAALGFTPVATVSRLPRPESLAAPPTTTAAPPLSREEARTAAQDNPEASSCLDALTTIVPPPAPSSDPHGAMLADAAQHAVGTRLEHPDAATFVCELFLKNAVRIPDSIAAQMTTGWSADDPEPGDLVFVDISADQGPHLVGITVTPDTMVTVLPGHDTPEWTRIGPNRIARRTEVSP